MEKNETNRVKAIIVATKRSGNDKEFSLGGAVMICLKGQETGNNKPE